MIHSKKNTARKLSFLVDRQLPALILAFRIPILVAVHLVVFASTYLLAFLIRFDGFIPAAMLEVFWKSLPIVCAIELAAFWFCNTFHGWWRYVTFRDLISLVKPLAVSYLAIELVDLLFLPYLIPRSIPVIQILCIGLILSVLRSSWRIGREVVSLLQPQNISTRAFIISNHHETLVLANQINCQQGSSTRIVGILSFGRIRRGTTRAGIPVVGSPLDAPRLARQYSATEVWLTAGSLPGNELMDLKKLYQDAGLIIKVIPSSTDRNLGASFIPLREIDINDLLRRPPVTLDNDQISAEIQGSRVMVTGAGGSIGSELCRQLLRFNPASLILVEHRENSVFLIQNELSQLLQESGNETTTLIPAIGDILDLQRMTALFETYQPQYVFHAAAHKHVGLMEVNAGEAIKNNILGTRQVADLANQFGVTKFVLVSTDKAVNPTSVMGCTKQIAERYVLSLGAFSDTKYVVVRFGNVLGSNGSVVPIFKEQIARGGPITITDPSMTRFFMTIPEATQLILQAGSMGRGGEIFVLDMGEQVRIVDLAEKMIELAGLPPTSIEIRFIGARPGEKLFEELYFDEEQSIKTSHHKIFAARHRMLNYEDVVQCINELAQLQTAPNELIRRQLKAFIPEYQLDSGRFQNAVANNEFNSSIDAEASDDSEVFHASDV
jgi:FlaA1/EpsC-like NDP-sugar epimerase